jgi:hypothetical protein
VGANSSLDEMLLDSHRVMALRHLDLLNPRVKCVRSRDAITKQPHRSCEEGAPSRTSPGLRRQSSQSTPADSSKGRSLLSRGRLFLCRTVVETACMVIWHVSSRDAYSPSPDLSAVACFGSFVAPVLDSDISSRAIWVRRLSAISSSASDLFSSAATAGSPI